jgi:hypothetical protein
MLMNVRGLLVIALVAASCSVEPPAEELNTSSSQESDAISRTTGDQKPASRPMAGAESTASRDEREAAKSSIVQEANQSGGNADAAILKDFKERIDKYVDIYEGAAKSNAKPKESSDPAKIIATQDALAARIRAARPTAKQGDIFTAEVRSRFRRMLAPALKGEDGRDAKALMKDDAPPPGSIPFEVNAKYPEGAPVPTVPASLLLSLPTLPRPLEYRVVGKHLLLLDTDAGLIVDYIPNAIT